MKKLLIISIGMFFLSGFVQASSPEINFNKILKKDGLLKLKKKNLEEKLKKNNEKKRNFTLDYSVFPNERKVLNLLSKLWLIQNKTSLQWDKQNTKYITKRSDISILYHNDKKLLNFVLPLEKKLLIVLNSRYMKLLDLNEKEEDIMISLLVQKFKSKFSGQKIIDSRIYKNLNKVGTLNRKFINQSLISLNKFILESKFSMLSNELISRTFNESKVKNLSLKSLVFKKSLVHSTLEF